MLTVGEWVDKVHEITDTLEHKATESCDEYIRKAQSYRDGYIQACEDFGREMRRDKQRTGIRRGNDEID